MQVRLYEPRDRAAVREICCDTADSGEPVETFFPDREGFADVLTRYYTDLNLRPDGRGQGTGRQLMEQFLRQAKDAGVRGVHLGVGETNAKGRQFFERFDFAALGRENRFRFPDAPDQQTFTIIYGKKL